jgi:AAA+ ATPase superfamily predicted ATPase
VNPFLTQGYLSPKYFCNRQRETKQILDALKSGNNLTLIAGRRKGKTSLILHSLRKHRGSSAYIDIYDTSSLEEFSRTLIRGVIEQIGQPKAPWIKRASRFFTQFRPVLSYNPVSGEAELNVQFDQSEDELQNLEQLFEFLSKENQEVVLAIDEFQQILYWDNPNAEATLRSLIQRYPLVRIIFCGSNRKLMFELFNNSKRPFYHSSELLFLPKIDETTYLSFIKAHLGDRILSEQNIQDCLRWCRGETYFIQRLFNRIYAQGKGTYKKEDLDVIRKKLILEKESEFQIQLRLLSKNQASFIIALGLSGGVSKPTSSDFLKKFNLSSTSTIAQNLTVLMEKDMVIVEDNEYKLADVFLEHWIRTRFSDSRSYI